MGCSEFFEGYSEFRDRLLPDAERAAFEAHLARCPGCAEYDRVVRRGVDAVRALPTLEPSSDFFPRLQHRIYHVEEDLRRRRSSSGSSLGIMALLALVIGASAWMPAARPRPAVVYLPPVTAHAPHRVEAVEALFRPGPLLTPRNGVLLGPPAPQATSTLLFRYTRLGGGMEAVPVRTLWVP